MHGCSSLLLAVLAWGKKPGKLVTRVTYLYIGGVAYSFCTALGQLSKPKKRHQHCLMLTTQWPMAATGSTPEFLRPHVHPNPNVHVRMSLHMTSFSYQAFPVLVPQATTAGVRRPGYKASSMHAYSSQCRFQYSYRKHATGNHACTCDGTCMLQVLS